MPKISVIVPVYNCEEFLDETFDCILNQTFNDFEAIFVDDGSTDDSLKILEGYALKDDRIQVYHQENSGGGVARNFAITKAKGKYIYFMDSDDLMDLNTLQATYDLIEKSNADFLLFKSLNYNYTENKYHSVPYLSMDEIYEIVGDNVFHYSDVGDLIFDISPTPWGKLYNKQFILDSHAEFGKTKAFHDNEFFWTALFSSKKIIFLNETLYSRRIHSNSIQQSHDKKFIDIIPVLDNIKNIFIKFNTLDDYKAKFYNWKINITHVRFSQIHEEYKELFFKEFKQDLLKNVNGEGEEELKNMLNSSNKRIVDSMLNANTYNEYLLLMEISELKSQIKKLKKKNRKLKKEKKELKTSDKGFLDKVKRRF